MRIVLRRLFFGLRLRLLLLALLTSAPAVALTLYTARENRHWQSAHWRQEAAKMLQLTSREESELIGGTRQLLRAVADSAQGPPRQWHSNCKKLLTRLLQDDQRYANLALAATNGDVLISALPLARPVNISDRPYFQRALFTQALSIGDYQVGRITGKPTINFGYPVRDEQDHLQAVVFAALDLDWLNRSQFPLALQVPAGTTWTKIDLNGTILVRQPATENWIGRRLPETNLLGRFVAQKNGEFEAADAHGVATLYLFAATRSPLVAGDLITILSIPRRVLTAEGDHLTRRSLALLGLLAGLVFLLGWIGSDLLVLRQVRALVQSSTRLASGDFSARTGLKHNEDELGQLTRTFDWMAQSLQQRESDHQRAEKELREREERFRALVQNSADVIGITDQQGVIHYHSPSFLSSLGYEAAAVVGKNIADFLWLEDLPRMQERIRELAQTPGRTHTEELRLVHRDGSCRHIECTLTNYLQDPAIGGIVFNYHDVTERKEAAEQLKHYGQRLQLLSHHLVEAQETERRRIARELHDEIGQSLTVAQIHLQTLARDPASKEQAARLKESLQVVEQVLAQVHDISLNLRPSMLDDLGLTATLRWYTNRQAALTGIQARIQIESFEQRLSPVVETECFRVAQEALTNIARHARAKQVTVELRQIEGQLHLRVRDDGVGFEAKVFREAATQGRSLGLVSMEERAALAGGGLEFKSAPGAGTEVHAWFPLFNGA